MKYEPRTHSLTLRLFSTVVLGMLALNILTLLSTHRLATAVQENTLKKYRQIQTMYADELTRQLTQAQERIGSISGSYLADMATSQEALGDQRAYEAVRCQTQISTAWRTWKEQYPLITGYYMYGTNAAADIKETISVDSDQFVVLDVNGEEINKSSLLFSVDHVDVSVPIGTTKMVPLTLKIEDTTGLTKEDCNVSIDPSQVEVTGDPEVLNSLESISLGSFSLDGLGESYEQDYDITYPEGVSSVDNVTRAKVKITIQGMEVREFTVTDIVCDNVPENMIAEPVGNLTILLRGSKDDLENVSEANLHAVADLANATHEAGSVTVPVTITCDINDIGIVGTYQMTVSLKNN